jgi:hypothetical protein
MRLRPVGIAELGQATSVSKETVNDSTPQTGPHGQHCVFPLIPVAPSVLKPAGPFKILFHHRDLKRPLNVDSRRHPMSQMRKERSFNTGVANGSNPT